MIELRLSSHNVPTVAAMTGCVFCRALLFSLMISGCLISSSPAQTHDQAPVELSGFSVSEAFEISDNDTLNVTEEKFQKLLYRVRQTSSSNLRHYARYSSATTWEQLTASTPDFRLWVFSRRGKVKSVKRIRLPGADRDAPINSVYLNDCVGDGGQPFQVITLSSPTAWRKSPALDQPIEFAGFLYGLVTPAEALDAETPDAEATVNGSAKSVPLFIAQRLAWFPTTSNAELGVTESQALLAQNGVDMGGLDLVRQEQNNKLERRDAEIFFQFLSAVNEIPVEPNVEALGIDALLNHPHENFGNVVAFPARVRKCTIVRRALDSRDNLFDSAQEFSGADDPSDSKSSDFDQYYQLIVFPDLKSQVVVNNPDPEKEDLVYRRFPVTVCCRHLPSGMQPTDIENQQIWVSGFYFRFWKYGSERTDAAGVSGQLSPLIISRQPIMVESDEGKLNLLMGFVLVGLLVGLLGLAWFFRGSGSAKKSRPENGSVERIDVPDWD